VRLVAALALLSCVACGAAPPRAADDKPPRATLDAAIELAALLPRGLRDCAVARPGALSALQRSVYGPLSQGHPLAFLPDAPFVAVARGRVARPDGRVDEIAFVRTSADRTTVRRFLEERSGVYLTWPDQGSVGERGRYQARFLDEHTLAIGRGDLPDSSRVGAEARCLSLASRFRGALEVSSAPGETDILPGVMAAPGRIEYRASIDGEHLTRIRVATFPRREEPDSRMLWSEDPVLGWLPLGLVAESRETRTEGRRIVERTRLSFQDLFLAAEDARRREAAIQDDARARGPHPVEEIDVENLGVVNEEVRMWKQQIDLPGAAGPRARRELSRLLEAAIAAHPRETELRAELFDVLARHVGDFVRAAEVASAAIADGVGDAMVFAQLRREAYARSDASRLPGALIADSIVPRREAVEAANAIRAAVLDGADYAFAEGAWIAGRALMRRAYRGPARRVASAHLDLAGLIEAIGILVDAADVGGAMWVAVEGVRRPWGIARFDAEDAPRIALDVGRSVLIGAASTNGDARLTALAHSLADSVSPGPIVLSFLVVPFNADVANPVAWGRIEGVLANDVLSVERIAGPSAAVDWGRVGRLIVGPLAASQGRVFPAPEVVIEADTGVEAEAILALSDLTAFVLCRRSDTRLTCRTAPGREDALGEFLAEIGHELLAMEAARITGR
jgi:hypothetical protein